MISTFNSFFTKVNEQIFTNNTEGENLKKEVKTFLILYLAIFLIIFFIFLLTTSIVTIKYYDEICSNNIELKHNMNIIYNLSILNIICLFIFIILFGLQYYDYDNIIIKFLKTKIFVYIFLILITSLNMIISSNFIINISKCNFKTYHLYNYMWINYAITLPICLLILILFIILQNLNMI
jgi:hypothetical protein